MIDLIKDIVGQFKILDSEFITFMIIAAVVMAAIGFFWGEVIQTITNKNKIKQERQDAVKRSRAVLGGQFSEQLAAFFPEFPCNPGDVRFVGKPIDFIAFPGTAEGKEVKDIFFIEVKTGDSQLSQREKEIKEAVQNKRVHYIEYRIPESK